MVAPWPQQNSLFQPPKLRPGGGLQPPSPATVAGGLQLPAPIPGTPPWFGANPSFMPSLPQMGNLNIPQAPVSLPPQPQVPAPQAFAQQPPAPPANIGFGFPQSPQPSQGDLGALLSLMRLMGQQGPSANNQAPSVSQPGLPAHRPAPFGFANNIQAGMDQIGSIIQGNVQRGGADRQFMNQLRLEAQIANNQHTERMAAISGRDRMLEGLLGSLRGGGSVPQPQQPGLSDAAAIQDQSAGSLYDDLLAQAAPAAMADSRLGGFGFSDPSGRFGSATLPGAGGGGIGELGINTSPGQIWNAQDAQDARSRLGSVVNATVPHLAGSGDGPVRAGLQNTFSDLLRGAAAKTYGGLERAGTQADASQTLAANMTNSQLQNVLWRLMGQMYAVNLGGDAQDNLLRSRALSALG